MKTRIETSAAMAAPGNDVDRSGGGSFARAGHLGAVALAVMALSACGGGSSSSGPESFDDFNDDRPDADDDAGGPVTDAGPGLPDSPDDEPQIIVTMPFTEGDLVVGGGGMLYRGYDNVAVIQEEPVANMPDIGSANDEIEFTIDDPESNPLLRIEKVFAVQEAGLSALDDKEADLVGILTNLSDTVQCNVSIALDSFQLSDGSSVEVYGGGTSSDAFGASGLSSIGASAGDCILPGSSIYFSYENVRYVNPEAETIFDADAGIDLIVGGFDSVSISRLWSVSRTDLDFPSGVVRATGGPDGSDLSILNTGDQAIDIESVAIYAVGETGLPVLAKHLGRSEFDEPLQPGGAVSIRGFAGFGSGLGGTRLVIVIGYENFVELISGNGDL